MRGGGSPRGPAGPAVVACTLLPYDAAFDLGATLAEALEQIGQVVEGVRTAQAALRLAAKYGVELPITEAVQSVLTGEKSAATVAYGLMARPIKDE